MEPELEPEVVGDTEALDDDGGPGIGGSMIVGALFCSIYVSIEGFPPLEYTHFTKWLIENLRGESRGGTRAPWSGW